VGGRGAQELKEAGLLLGSRMLGNGYLHYGYWNGSLEVSLENLAAAQQAFAEQLFARIPAGVRSLLDVGCGTGLLASHLLRRGYEVEAVQPSTALADVAARRLGPGVPIHRVRFQELELSRRFDLVLFSESFQYIPVADALATSASLLDPGGHLLIADFFRTDVPGKGPVGGGHKLSSFYPKLREFPFSVQQDEDITARTAPTVVLMGRFWSEYGIPAGRAVMAYLRERHPLWALVANLLLVGQIRKLRAKYDPAKYTAEEFARHCSYRLILLRREPGAPGPVRRDA
jgi:SAM-dependent methyltransferase